MLLLDFEHAGVVLLKDFLAHMLTAATLIIIAKPWKTQEKASVTDWIAKVKYMCLINKLTAIIKVRMGNTNALKKCECD